MIATQTFNSINSINSINSNHNNTISSPSKAEWRQVEMQSQAKGIAMISSSSSDDDDDERMPSSSSSSSSSTLGGTHPTPQSKHSSNKNKNKKKRPSSEKEDESVSIVMNPNSHKQARRTIEQPLSLPQPPLCSSHYKPKQTRDLKTWFRIRKHVGEGTFGSIFLTLDLADTNNSSNSNNSSSNSNNEPKHKIIKRVKTREDKSVMSYGFPYTALREIKLLGSIEHENVILLHEVVTTKGTDGFPEHVFMVLEYMEYDLSALLRLPILSKQLTKTHVQSWTRQLLQGCEYLHAQRIMHRDLKPANLLINKQGTLKIGDFGLARRLDCNVVEGEEQNNAERKYTTKSIGTPWYRAPEILIGCGNYNTKVDMWSIGCVLFELACTKPLFHATTTMDLYRQVDKQCALIREEPTWLAQEMAKTRSHHPVLTQNDILLSKLIGGLLHLGPKSRLTAKDALKDEFFFFSSRDDQNQKKLNMNFPLPSCHDLDVYKYRLKKQQKQQQQGK
ncbi:MAG: hypothetical protein SGBAC_012554 [Bacillariaceae sp.]